LVKKYGGVIWGEHGKGYRSVYTEKYFGPALYSQLGHIKKAFDPNNQLNPGKIAVPTGSSEKLVSINGPKRGHQDRLITTELQDEFETAISCNGNGACFHVSPKVIMCPSAKSSSDRVHSPKGRAGLMREWLRRVSKGQWNPNQRDSLLFSPLIKSYHWALRQLGVYDFNHEVFLAMDGCLSCKACVTQCPIHVDIPEMKSKFLQVYYQRHLRPISDSFAANLESLLPLRAYAPKITGFFLSRPLVKNVLKNWVGIVDPPVPSHPSLRSLFHTGELRLLDLSKKIDPHRTKKDVILIQDSFTSFYESKLVLAFSQLCDRLGYRLWVLPHFPNGKAMHVKGMLRPFDAMVAKNNLILVKAAQTGIPLVGLDPALTLTYRDEYLKSLKVNSVPYRVLLPQEWLVQEIEAGAVAPIPREDQVVRFLGHCTQKALVSSAQKDWVHVFAHLGITLKVEEVGCCGMSGIYGHETKHRQQSEDIFNLSWLSPLQESIQAGQPVVADGFSCRSQTKRVMGTSLQHPIEYLLTRC